MRALPFRILVCHCASPREFESRTLHQAATCFPLGLLVMSLSWCERGCCLVSRQPPAWCLIIAGSHCSIGACACCPFQQHSAKPIAAILHTGSRPHPPNYIQYLVTAHILVRSRLGCRSVWGRGVSLSSVLFRKLHELCLLLSITILYCQF